MFRAVDEALFGLSAALMSWLLIKSRQLQEKTENISARRRNHCCLAGESANVSNRIE